MRYATWELNWQPDENYGTGPEAIIAERGGSAEGALFLGTDSHSTIVGYVHGAVNLDDLGAWNVQEISADEALTLVQAVNREAFLDADGRVGFPRPDLGA